MDHKPPPRSEPTEPYHGMTWPVRVVVYGAGGVVVMGFVVLAMRLRLDGSGGFWRFHQRPLCSERVFHAVPMHCSRGCHGWCWLYCVGKSDADASFAHQTVGS